MRKFDPLSAAKLYVLSSCIRGLGCLEFVTIHLRLTNKAVKRKVRVEIRSHSLTRWAQANGACPTCSRTRHVEGDNRAISGAHKAVRHKVRVEVLPRGGATRIGACRN